MPVSNENLRRTSLAAINCGRAHAKGSRRSDAVQNPPRAQASPSGHRYAQRHLIERYFSKLKQFRCATTRFEKTAKHYPTIVTLAASILWLR